MFQAGLSAGLPGLQPDNQLRGSRAACRSASRACQAASWAASWPASPLASQLGRLLVYHMGDTEAKPTEDGLLDRPKMLNIIKHAPKGSKQKDPRISVSFTGQLEKYPAVKISGRKNIRNRSFVCNMRSGSTPNVSARLPASTFACQHRFYMEGDSFPKQKLLFPVHKIGAEVKKANDC